MFEGEKAADDCKGHPSRTPGCSACMGYFRSGNVGQSSVLLTKANKAPNLQKYYSSTAGKIKDLKSKWCEQMQSLKYEEQVVRKAGGTIVGFPIGALVLRY